MEGAKLVGVTEADKRFLEGEGEPSRKEREMSTSSDLIQVA